MFVAPDSVAWLIEIPRATGGISSPTNCCRVMSKNYRNPDSGLPGRRDFVRSPMNASIVHQWAIMVHDPSPAIGQVVETIYPTDGEPTRIEQELVLKDGTHWKFLLTELRLATDAEAREFLA